MPKLKPAGSASAPPTPVARAPSVPSRLTPAPPARGAPSPPPPSPSAPSVPSRMPRRRYLVVQVASHHLLLLLRLLHLLRLVRPHLQQSSGLLVNPVSRRGTASTPPSCPTPAARLLSLRCLIVRPVLHYQHAVSHRHLQLPAVLPIHSV